MTRPALLCFLAATAFAQIQPTVPEPTNIDFSQGEDGQIPPGWNMPPAVLDAGYRAELRHQDCGARFSVCVGYVRPAVLEKVRAAELQQTFPAAPYIGKAIRFSAWLRMDDASGGGYVHIRMRIDYPGGRVDMRDSTAPPVTVPEWQKREVVGQVEKGAVSISIWARYVPSGSAWVASPAFEVVKDLKVPASFGVATAAFPVEDAVGKTVHFSGWIRTEDVANGYAGLWWRVDGAARQVLAFDNSVTRMIDGKPASGHEVIRGATGTSGWKWYEIDLPVSGGATNINFGLVFTGTGTAWFDSLKIELNGEPYANPKFDFDFESPTLKGFAFAGDNGGRYKVGLDDTVGFTGRQSLKMQFVGDKREPEAPRPRVTLTAIDPAKIDHSQSVEFSTRTSISFINHSSSTVDIYWIDYQGARVLKQAALPSGGTWQTGTFVSHPWLVVASGSGATQKPDTGLRLAGFEPSASPGDAIITDKR
jgi:hypothetical protein